MAVRAMVANLPVLPSKKSFTFYIPQFLICKVSFTNNKNFSLVFVMVKGENNKLLSSSTITTREIEEKPQLEVSPKKRIL